MTCAICDSVRTTPFMVARDMFTGEAHRIVRCDGCALIRTERSPSSEAMYVYRGTADAGARFGRMQGVLRMLRRARVRQLAGLRPGRALDVGCGDGSFLAALAQLGWEVCGTELSPSVAATARERLGERISTDTMEKTGPDSSFDLITFWHVLEHMDDPRSALNHARRLIKPDGSVIIAVPNIESFQAQMFKQDWLHLDVPRHRWHFEPGTLTRLADRCGFEVDHVRHFSVEHGPFGIVQGIATKLGGGHVLFTRLVRLSPLRLLRDASFWMHLLIVPLLTIPSILIEALAAIAKRGGTIVVVLKPRS